MRAGASGFKVLFPAALACAALSGPMRVQVDAAPKPAVHEVAIEGLSFHPETLVVAAGDTILWVNKDLFPHTVTADAGAFDSHEIAAGRSWRYTAARKGTYPYRCTLHPTMHGELRVK
jgi:plastocyanin